MSGKEIFLILQQRLLREPIQIVAIWKAVVIGYLIVEWLMERAPIPGVQTCVPSPYTSPISPCHTFCVTGRCGCLWNLQLCTCSKSMCRGVCMPNRTIPTKYPSERFRWQILLLSPTFAPGQVCKVGHTNDR